MVKESSYSIESTNISTYYQKRLIDLLNTSEIEYKSEEQDPLVLQINIDIRDTSLNILISPTWIGYKLKVHIDNQGRTISIQNDTDLYPLDDDITASKEIGEEVLNVLTACINGKIYVGHKDKKNYLAVPIKDDTYRLVIGKKFSSSEKLVTYKELEKIDFIKLI